MKHLAGYILLWRKRRKEVILKSILITGVGGFIGRALASHYTSAGYKVYGADRLHRENAPHSSLIEYAQLELPSTLFDDLLRRWRPDIVLHCAGRASVPGSMEDPRSDYFDGPALTFAILDSLRTHARDCAFLLLSSAAVYGNPDRLPINESTPPHPISPYGFHKWQSEIICREFSDLFNVRTASARVFSAYGPGLRRQVLWDIARKALTDDEVRLQGTGQESRDFIHVKDIARGLETLINYAPMQGEVYNLASGNETHIADIANVILELVGRSKPLLFSRKLLPGTPRNWQADMTLISSLGFEPIISLQAGIAGFIEWARREIEGV